MPSLCQLFKHYRGQPIEVITEGIRVCGINVESDEDGVTLVDRKGRLVRISFCKIEAVIEPQMKLRRLCERDDCECHEHGKKGECECEECDECKRKEKFEDWN